MNLETAGRELGLFAGILGSIAVIWKFIVSPIKKAYLRHKAREQAIKDLTTNIADLKDSIESINSCICSLQTARAQHDQADTVIRRSIYHGQIATISALREMASHMGLKINGPVELYYKQNIEALKTELGIKEDP